MKYIITHQNKIPFVSVDNIMNFDYPDPWNPVNGPTPNFWYTLNLDGSFSKNEIIQNFQDCGALGQWYSNTSGAYNTTTFAVIKESRTVNAGYNSHYYYSSSANHNSQQGSITFNYISDSLNPTKEYQIYSNYYNGLTNVGQRVIIPFTSVATQSNCLFVVSSRQQAGAPLGGIIDYHTVNGFSGTVTNNPGIGYVSSCFQYQRNGFRELYTNGGVLEYIVYYSNLTSGNRTTVENYLKAKWNITY